MGHDMVRNVALSCVCVCLSVSFAVGEGHASPSAGEATSSHTASWSLPQRVGVIRIPRPAFLELTNPGEGKPRDLIVSSFRLLGADALSAYRDVGRLMRSEGWTEPGAAACETAGTTLLDREPSADEDGFDTWRPEDFQPWQPEIITTAVTWPNESSLVPPGVFNHPALIVAGGFLVPGKRTGALSLIPYVPGGEPIACRPFVISNERPGWFYHRALFHDFHGDGNQSIVTARAHVPFVGSPRGELVLLTPPEELPLPLGAGRWVESVLAEGPDVHFRIADLGGDGSIQIIATEFFSKRLTLYGLEIIDGEVRVTRGRIIDDTLGSAFDLELVDLDGDGRLDLLVTNHESDEQAAVFAYQIPDEPFEEPWPRRTLISGFVTSQWGINQASPGAAQAFRPGPGVGRPWILVAGDGSQCAHLLRPLSEEPGTWDYEELVILEGGGTVGLPAVGDVTGDGWMEIFIPVWERNEIHVFRCAP